MNYSIADSPDAAYAARMITVAQIRAARGLLGWSQTDLANAAGVAVITIKNIERGSTDPKGSTLAAIEDAFERAGVLLGEPGDRRAKGRTVGFAEREGPKPKS